MKLIRETRDKGELERIRMLLESRGIPVHVSDENQQRLGGHAMFFLRYRIHVVLDDHYDDALKLLEDENHQVADPVDIDSFRKYQEEAQPAVLNQMLGWSVAILVILSVLLYIMLQVSKQ